MQSNRKILSGVRIGAEVFLPGQEKELAAAASAEDLKRLGEKGAIAGSWQKEKPLTKPEHNDSTGAPFVGFDPGRKDNPDDPAGDDPDKTADTEIPGVKELQKMKKAELVAVAESLKIAVVPDAETNKQIIEKILSYAESVA